MRTEIRYDELKVNDVIRFHGANVKVVAVREYPTPANEFYPNEKTIRFDIEPYDDEAEKILGSFYSRGTYGGVGCLKATVINR